MQEEKVKKVVIYQYSSCEKRKNCVTIEKDIYAKNNHKQGSARWMKSSLQNMQKRRRLLAQR